MKSEEYNTLIQGIRENVGDVAKVTESLTLLAGDYNQVTSDLEASKTELAKMQEENNKLLKANFNLFQQVTVKVDKKKEENFLEDEQPKKKTFEELFDKEGKLI